MRSAMERVRFLDTLSAVRKDAAAGMEAVRTSTKSAVKGAGMVGLGVAGVALGARICSWFFSKPKVVAAPVKTDWRLALGKHLATLLLVPLAKEFVVKRLAAPAAPEKALPAPQTEGIAPQAAGVRVREGESFFSRFSISRFCSRLLGK